MPFTVNDETSSTSRLQASNSGGVELGPAAAGSSLTVNGNQLLNGSSLASGRIPSAGLNRVTGSVTITSHSRSNVTVGSVSGFGTVSGAILITFGINQFSCALADEASGVVKTCAYSVI